MAWPFDPVVLVTVTWPAASSVTSLSAVMPLPNYNIKKESSAYPTCLVKSIVWLCNGVWAGSS